jgi:hypothetical protein
VQRAQAAAALGDAPAALESMAFVAAHARLVLLQARRARRPVPQGERLSLDASLQALVRLLHAHPAWQAEPRGPAVFTAVEDVRMDLLLPTEGRRP